MEAKTTTQRSAAHRQRQREKMARYEGALRGIAATSVWVDEPDAISMRDIAKEALGL